MVSVWLVGPSPRLLRSRKNKDRVVLPALDRTLALGLLECIEDVEDLAAPGYPPPPYMASSVVAG